MAAREAEGAILVVGFPESSIMAFFFAEPVRKQNVPADSPKLEPTQPEHRIDRSNPEEMAASVLKAFPHQQGRVRVITIRNGAVTSALNGIGKQGYTDEFLESLGRMGLDFQHEELEYGEMPGSSPAADHSATTPDNSSNSTPAVAAEPEEGQLGTHPEGANASQKWYNTWGLVLAPTEEACVFERVCAFADMPFPVPLGRSWEDVKTSIVMR
ncbi:hypothetical protein INS49_004161 [Diaporthe citri]|uniref:uncharacterized protein n=1 Tax=Diaporthe citri TaxID=83186 RepID=UPI001C8224B1|nr:uncharacterized protein INS49_004161 [Diaporthe citri]KAG6355080.1 hypothetical protein INS49_004161 [Diaporthe citri]